MRQWTGSALVQILACGLFGAKPFPEPMLAYCRLHFWEQISVKFESEFYHLHLRKSIWNCRLPKWRPFCPGGDELTCRTQVGPMLAPWTLLSGVRYWNSDIEIWELVIHLGFQGWGVSGLPNFVTPEYLPVEGIPIITNVNMILELSNVFQAFLCLFAFFMSPVFTVWLCSR